MYYCTYVCMPAFMYVLLGEIDKTRSMYVCAKEVVVSAFHRHLIKHMYVLTMQVCSLFDYYYDREAPTESRTSPTEFH